MRGTDHQQSHMFSYLSPEEKNFFFFFFFFSVYSALEVAASTVVAGVVHSAE